MIQKGVILGFLICFLMACQSKKQTAIIQVSDNQISLNGTWNFIAANNLSEEKIILDKAVEWDTLSVPGNWDTTEKYATFKGKGYYQRKFSIPEDLQESQIRIQFGAVYQTSKVWLNGVLLGNHVGGYTPFEFNITPYINQNKENILVVLADNTYSRGAWWAWGGISRSVTLVKNQKVRMVRQHITAIPNFDDETVAFTISYKLENNDDRTVKVDLNSEILFQETAVLSKEHQVVLQSNSVQVSNISFTQKLSNFKLWDFNHPNLYQLKTALLVDKIEQDEQKDNFGVRKIEAKGEQLFLNNKPVKMNGFNRVHDHPKYGNTEPDELVQKDMLDIKSLGGVFSRLMHSPQAPNLLDFCDKIGYLIIEEIPVWGDDDPQTFKGNPLTKKWLSEMIERDYNHPSVVGWSVGNELRDSIKPWGKKTLTKSQLYYINSMLDHVDDLDKTRLKTYVSLTSYGKNTDQTNEPFEKLDLLCINSYGDAVKAAKSTHEKFPGKPIFVSEIGIKQIGPATEGELSAQLIDQLQILKTLPYVVGSSIWSYNDYRSDYKGTPASGFREWGVVNEKRAPKKAYQQIKKIYKN
ncbi:glycoside hydrolase [Polaribacter reichenbachii]|uniref:Glycoside hydrolase n=2 Tax=Polaribacter reichenbachii TaxID=996801 RepID=A0A1B8TV88_9FLAO|nr:glycoside hydrolase [Polaribacter reichenbachii]AUC19416.1 glycoside hydrolase [Polaribacter reichenbachii]OBY63429.1 glycoside hydrolase [Polaribacter reichenbachii]